MDDKSISQNSELTEHVHRRRLSSILKAPRSPLKDLGSGNELCQEPIIDKRRKSLRRVSFAETIRVFTPELQSAGSDDKENEGFRTSTNVNKETANKCGIAGMDTLLHGAIQATGHSGDDDDWNNADCTKDRTIFFCADNDMDLTTSNTMAIHGLIEKKIDTSQFLASLKAPSNEMAQNKDFVLSLGVDKQSDFTFKKDSSMENKVKFSDFLTSLGSEKSKATNFLEDAEKENLFPFIPTHFHTGNHTGNVTQMFREQDDGLDLTKCHTTNIDSFFPTINRETTNHFIFSDNDNRQPQLLTLSELSHLKNFGLNNNVCRSASNNQTVFIEDDMDITRSHTSRIRQDAQLHTYQNETPFPFDKTVIFDEHEMEMTRNNSVLLNKNPSVASVQRKDRVSCVDHTTILPQGEDMDITQSHTVAIDGLTVEQVRPQAMSHLAGRNGGANDHVRRSSGLALNSQMVPSKSLNTINGPSVGHLQSGVEHHTTYASKLEYKPEDPGGQVKQAEQNKMVSTLSSLEPSEEMLDNDRKSAANESTKSLTIAVNAKPLQETSKKDNKSYFNCLKLPSVSNKSILFSTESDDLKLTQSHTVFIDQKALNRDNKNNISLRIQQRDSSGSTREPVGKTNRGLRVQENTALIDKTTRAISSKQEPMMNATNHLTDDMEISVFGNDTFGKSPPSSVHKGNKTTIFTCDQQDMEITRSQTVLIGNVLCERLQYDTCNTYSNNLDFSSTISKCPSTNTDQDGYTIGKKQEAESLSKSLCGLQFDFVNPGHTMPAESTRKVCTTLQNSVFFKPDQDDMDITFSNTASVKNIFLHGNSITNKSVPFVPPTLKSAATDKSVFEDDMEFTKSHTMIIDDRNLVGLPNPSTSVKNIQTPKMVTNPITIWSEIDPTHNISKQQLNNETVPQEADMEMTNVNAGLLIAARKSQSWNKVNPSFELKDKTVHLCDQDDMDITRTHTIAIENKVIEENDANLSMPQDSATVRSAKSHPSDVKYIPMPHSAHDFDEKPYTSWTQFDPEMDITVSNTVTINTENPRNDLQLPISKSKVLPSAKYRYLDSMERDNGNHIVFDQESKSHLEKNAPVSVELPHKTLPLYEHNDMDITRSHTTAIESKILKGLKDDNVEAEFQKLSKRGAVPDLTNNGINMAGNITSVYGACSKGEDMDMTMSNTVFTDHMLDKLHTKDVHVSDILPKRKTVFGLPKSLVASDETILLVCNMEETNVNVHLSEGLVNRSSFDKPTCDQSDMEMTKSHTVAIAKPLDSAHIIYPVSLGPQVSTAVTSCDQGNLYTCEMDGARPPAEAKDGPRAESAEPLVSKPISCEMLKTLPDPKDAAMTFSGMVKGNELTKFQGDNGLLQRSKHLLDGDETIFPNEQSMDVTKAHTDVDGSSLDNSSIPSTSIVVTKGDAERTVSVKVSGELMDMEQKCDLNEPIKKLDKCRRKSYARSGIFLEALENEVSCNHTNSIEESLLKTNTYPRSSAEKDFTVDKGLDNSVDFVDREHISFGNCISPNADPNQNPIFPEKSCNSSACKVESLEEDNVPDMMGYENGLKSQLEIKGENLKTSESRFDTSLNCDPSCFASDSTANMRPEEQKTCVLPVEALTSAPQKDSEMAIGMKKAKLKGKRVSFHVPEIEMVSKEVIQPFVSRSKNYDEVEDQERIAHITDQLSNEYTTKSDFMDQESVIGIKPDTENLEDYHLHKGSDVTSNMAIGFLEHLSTNVAFSTLAELPQNSTNKRRSIADIQLKIKRLSEKSKPSHSHTAPISGLIEQLPAESQILCSSGSENVLLNAELPNTVTTQEKEPIQEKNKITREKSLTIRLSVKMLQPKLPNKRALSTSNNVEQVKSSVSEAEHQNPQCSKALLKSFKVLDDEQCIDEEMLPACPDDQEINNVLQYEVPEGAWEELCQEEAVQQNLDISTMQSKDTLNGQKRVRDTEEDFDSQRKKRGRWKGDILEKEKVQNTLDFKGSDKSYRSDSSSHHARKTMEQTCSSSSSQDSKGDGMSVDLSSQQCSQMDSQLPWDTGCEQSLWQKFQDGTITVQEFFVLLRIRVLIQKPRYSEVPSKRGVNEDLTASEILLNQYIYQPKLQMYEEECHTLYQTIEELKASTELQHKPLVQINSLLWEALRMCSENELMYFGVTLKNMKSLYSKKSKCIAHVEKVSTYSKLLHSAQAQCENLQARLQETDELLKELDDCISSLETETARLNEECGNESLTVKGCVRIQAEIDCLKSQEQLSIRESLELEERKQQILGQLDCLQEKERVNHKHLQELSYTEWDLVKWTDKEATFIFLYNSLELSITFGDSIDGEYFNKKPCRKMSNVTVESQLDDEVAHPSSVLVHRLILQYIEKGAFHETYKNQNNLPQLLFNLSLVVSRCRLLGEELEYLIKWGAKYNIVKTQVQSLEVKLLFSSLAALVKFELIIHLSDTYPTVPPAFTLNNLIGSITKSRLTAIMSKVPTGLWYLKRTVKSIHKNLLL